MKCSGSLLCRIDDVIAIEAAGEVGTQSIYTYEMPPGKPRVRICKVASKDNALPGDIVDFTLRFDNVGDQPVGNVTLIGSARTGPRFRSHGDG